MAKRVYMSDLFREATRVMRENLLRTFLTVLGITIGVTSLITVMTVIEGATDYVADEIADLGSNVFQVTKLANISEGIDEVIKSFRRKNITWDNYRFVRDHARWAVRVGAQAGMGGTVRFGNTYIQDSRIDGVTANMIDISTRECGGRAVFYRTGGAVLAPAVRRGLGYPGAALPRPGSGGQHI